MMMMMMMMMIIGNGEGWVLQSSCFVKPRGLFCCWHTHSEKESAVCAALDGHALTPKDDHDSLFLLSTFDKAPICKTQGRSIQKEPPLAPDAKLFSKRQAPFKSTRPCWHASRQTGKHQHTRYFPLRSTSVETKSKVYGSFGLTAAPFLFGRGPAIIALLQRPL
jgi:hypothetical protein